MVTPDGFGSSAVVQSDSDSDKATRNWSGTEVGEPNLIAGVLHETPVSLQYSLPRRAMNCPCSESDRDRDRWRDFAHSTAASRLSVVRRRASALTSASLSAHCEPPSQLSQ